MARPLRQLNSVLAAQHNVVGRWQMTSAQIRAARLQVHHEQWQEPTNQVFVVGNGPLSDEQRMWVAVLHGGPDARLAERTALTLHGWKEPPSSPFHVVASRKVTRSKTPDWVKLHHITKLVGTSHQPARVDVHTATIQAANWARSDREAMFILLSCLQQRLASAHRILARLPAHCARRELIADMAEEFLNGITSVNEHDFATLCRGWSLPEPVRQSRLYDGSGKPRAIYAEFRLPDGRSRRVEIEGMHHFEPVNFMADIDRHNELIVQGDVYLRVASYTVKYEPDHFRPVLTSWLSGQQLPAAS